jgi:hypothetical protein
MSTMFLLFAVVLVLVLINVPIAVSLGLVADGAMVAAEADFLESLLEHLAVSEDDARQATRILSIKNRY